MMIPAQMLIMKQFDTNIFRQHENYSVPRCDVIKKSSFAIHRFAYVEDEHLETDVHSACSSMEATVRHEVLQELLVGIVSILEQYCKLPHGSLSTATIMALSLDVAQSAGNMHSCVP
jgi:hypothetical protein